MPYVGARVSEENKLVEWYNLKRLGIMLLNGIHHVDELRARIWEHEELQGIADEILASGTYSFDFEFYDESSPEQILRLDYVYRGVQKSISYIWKAKKD
ncbi:hypothetical protein R4Z10_08515 [Niallia sp. XMNu-256]|uniref:hypothetical protein n=1 Tax=Niallia sp. XMNu-256 TaxID=3082444 RepID=UPI0030D50A73